VRNEISTLTAEARFTGLIIMVLPVITLAMLNQTMEGAVSTFLNDPLGWVITTVFIAVLVAAFVLINRFAHVRV
jgi:Flp pilus assembly protein TadB